MGLDIQSKEVIDKISDELKVQPSMAIPRELMDKIQLVYGVNPERIIRSLHANVSDSTSGTIFTTATNKKTFIVGVQLSITKDVVSTSLFSNITFTDFLGTADKILMQLRYEPVTAGNIELSTTFTHPVEVQPGTAVAIANSTNIASIDTTGVVFFYETDPQ